MEQDTSQIWQTGLTGKFGKDRATGEGAEDLFDVCEEIDKEEETMVAQKDAEMEINGDITPNNAGSPESIC